MQTSSDVAQCCPCGCPKTPLPDPAQCVLSSYSLSGVFTAGGPALLLQPWRPGTFTVCVGTCVWEPAGKLSKKSVVPVTQTHMALGLHVCLFFSIATASSTTANKIHGVPTCVCHVLHCVLLEGRLLATVTESRSHVGRLQHLPSLTHAFL